MATRSRAFSCIVTVFSRKDMDRLGARRLIELLRMTPGFVEVASPMKRNIASRGVHSSTSQNVVVPIDGLRMNDFLANTRQYFFDNHGARTYLEVTGISSKLLKFMI